MVRVKVCGITNWTDARMAVDAGADALGFNFYAKSPRFVPVDEARMIARRLPRRVQTVGVFVNEKEPSILRIVHSADLNAIQLHGEEAPAAVQRLDLFYPVIKAFRVRNGFRPETLARYKRAAAYLLDGFHARARGGTGKTFDWKIAAKAKRYGCVVLAGGLTAENAGEAIAAAEPFAIDVCSGVESRPGKKDAQRLREFMKAVEKACRSIA